MRRMVIVLACFAMVLGTTALHPRSGSGGLPLASAQEEEEVTVDSRASRLVDRLGRFCGSYDFYFRHFFAKGEMRPVRCSRGGREKTALLVYSFSDRRTKKAWLVEWGGLADQRGSIVIRGKRWTVEVLIRKWAPDIRKRL